MNESPEQKIDRNWTIAIVALLVLLIVGIAVYLRMGAPLREPNRAALACPSQFVTRTPAIVARIWV